MCCIKTETNFEQNYLRFRKSSEKENHPAEAFIIIATCNHAVDAVGQVWKKCPRFMIRGREITLYRQHRPWKSSATQTQCQLFGIFWSLDFPWAPSVGFWGIMRREEKLWVRQAAGKWQIQIEGRELEPLNCLKAQPEGKSTKNWP